MSKPSRSHLSYMRKLLLSAPLMLGMACGNDSAANDGGPNGDPDASDSMDAGVDAEAPDSDAEVPDANLRDGEVSDAEVTDAEVSDADVSDAEVSDADLPDASCTCGDGVVCGTEECDVLSFPASSGCMPSCRLNLTVDTAGQCTDYAPAVTGTQSDPRAPVDPIAVTFAAPLTTYIARTDLSVIDSNFWNGAVIQTAAQFDGKPGTDLELRIGGTIGSQTFALSSDGAGGFSGTTLVRSSHVSSQTGSLEQAPIFDFNADGRPDFVFYYPGPLEPPSIRAITLSAPGEGVSYTSVPLALALAPTDVHGAPMNKDGKTDIFHSYQGACGWSVVSAISNGDGTFAAPTKQHIDATPTSAFVVKTADVTGDGAAELLRLSSDDAGYIVDVAKNDGEAHFSAKVRTTFAGFSAEPYLADIDGDGKIDLVFANADADALVLQVALSRGDGSFAALATWKSASIGENPAVGLRFHDLNKDQRADLVLWRAGYPHAEGRGDGQFSAFAAAEVLPLVTTAKDGSEAAFIKLQDPPVYNLSLLFGDFNGDGNQDLLEARVDYDRVVPGQFNGWKIRTLLSAP